MDRKIKHMLYIAYKNNVEVLILGAWGCNAFGNPIEQVAHLFYENLKDNNYFKKIIFLKS